MGTEGEGEGDSESKTIDKAVDTGKNDDKDTKKPKAQENGSFFALFSNADTIDKLLIVLGLLGAIANGAAFPLFAYLFGDFTNTFGDPSASFTDAVKDVALAFLYVAIGTLVASMLESACLMISGARQTNRLRALYLKALLRQEVAFFDVDSTTGGLLQGLNEDSMAVQTAISEKFGQCVKNLATFLGGYGIAFWAAWDMALVLMACLPLLGAVGAGAAKYMTYMTTKANEIFAKANTVAQQSISQVRTVAAYGQEERCVAEYEEVLVGPTKLGIKQAVGQGLAHGAVQLIIYNVYGIAFFYGAYAVADGRRDGGQIVTSMLSALLGGFVLGLNAPNFAAMAKGASSGHRILSAIKRKPTIDPDAPGEEPAVAGVKGELELKNVRFAYPARPDQIIFQDLCLEVPAGKTVALVGSSGSGKSTVIALIERFYDPLGGMVLFDGIDIRQLSLKWLRNQVGLVSQEPTLFATTIYENIAMGKEGATREEVEAAAVAANVHRFIQNLPLGFETHAGERGVQLSGGQKQRIAIARAILKNPRVLLLDEATSALDTESERIVQATLNRMIVGRTTVVVAHRLSTVKDADIIAVVSKGVIVEKGSHHELIADPTGVYTNLVKLQMSRGAEMAIAEAIDEEEGVDEDAVPEPAAASLIVAGAAIINRNLMSGRVQSTALPHQVLRPSSEHADLAGSQHAAEHGVAGTITIEPQTSVEAMEAGIMDAAHVNSSNKDKLKPTAKLSGAGAGQEAQEVAGPHSAGPHSSMDKAGPLSAEKGRLSLSGLDGKAAVKGKNEKEEDKGDGKSAEAKPEVPGFVALMRMNKQEIPYMAIGSTAAGIFGCVSPAFSLLFSSMITLFYDTDPDYIKHRAGFYTLMFFVIGSGGFIMCCISQFCFGTAGIRLASRIRVKLLQAILRQEIGWFDLPDNTSGTLTAKLSTDTTHVRGAVGDAMGMIVQNLTCMVFGFVLSYTYNWRMGLVVTGILPLMAVASILHMRLMTGMHGSAENLYASANQTATESLQSIRVVHAYNLQNHTSDRYGAQLHKANQAFKKHSMTTAAAMSYSNFMMFGVYSLIIWFAGNEIANGRSDFDKTLKSFLAVLFAAMGLAQAQMDFPYASKASAAIQRIFPIIQRVPAIDTADQSGEQPAEVQGQIELANVRFAYPSRPKINVFRKFSLTIPAGQMVALVGESGSGKSTIVGLIERFYEPLEGTIMLDGQDIRAYNIKWLRSKIGLVSQEPLLFSASILDNIRYGKPDASMDEVEAAARAANAHDFISSLHDGYNTFVGEQGVQLSGGQKQRVAIARAVVRNPRILLLDEATSALDAQSERVVQEALDRIMVGRTSVVVAHRLSTIRHASLIALVYRGIIMEQGTHDELMQIPNGGYARLVHAQMARAPSEGRSLQHVASMAKAAAAANAE